MYQAGDIETMRQHHRKLLMEAEKARLARQLKEARSGGGSFSGRMGRRAALLLFAIGLVVVLIASAAYALDVQCPPSVGDAACLGTEGNDIMDGTDGLDLIVGLGGDDIIRGLALPTGSLATATRRRSLATTNSSVARLRRPRRRRRLRSALGRRWR